MDVGGLKINTFAVMASFNPLAGWIGFGVGVAAATWERNEEVALHSLFLTFRWAGSWSVMLNWSCWPPYDDWSECQRRDAWGNWKSLKPLWVTTTRQTITLLSHVVLHVGLVGVQYMFEADPALIWLWPAWLWLIDDAIFGIPVYETQPKSAEILFQTTNNRIFCMYLLEILIKKLWQSWISQKSGIDFQLIFLPRDSWVVFFFNQFLFVAAPLLK
jgi:hypothetical protein